MTEEEAKTKWCPNARDAKGGNRYESKQIFESMNCLASKCGVWEETYRDERGTHGKCGLIKM